MFERRLKIFLIFLAAAVSGLLLRAAQLQMFQREYWRKEASAAMRKVVYLETDRGRIVDRKDHELAVDRPCVDACVDFRAIVYPADEKWMRNIANERLKMQLGDALLHMPKKQREKLRDDELPAIQNDINAMWDKLAELSNRSREEIEQIRQSILQRVEIRKKYVWYHAYERAIRREGDEAPDIHATTIEKWLSGESEDGPQIDKFSVTVAEETMSHVILHAINLDVQNELGRHIDRYPGLVLQPGLHRYYPFDDVASHLLGHLSKVNGEDLKQDPNRGDPRRQYLPNDDIGRGGLEWLCEPALRGTLGRVTTVYGEDASTTTDPPVPGQTVRTTIDIDLQQEIQNFFASATMHDPHDPLKEAEHNAVLHGAAVLLDVKTNQLLALVSYPTYDLNHFDELYQRLHDDEINEPLRNRATESQLEPGSTVKPLVGLSAITQGTMGVNEGIECTGYLVLPWNGKPHTYSKSYRCWVASMYTEALHGDVAHHPIPFQAPHRGHDGNSDGFLTYSDALERSCNVYFETVADRMGIDLLTTWMGKFGLGRRTGVGLEEYKGRVPGDAPSEPGQNRRDMGLTGGIGQGYVAATPIQMANVAATIARGGIWMRPKVIMRYSKDGATPPLHSGAMEGPDVVDLHLDPEAVAACKLGMINVVNSRAGTGTAAHMQELLIAAKTGTAQAAPFKILARDAKGQPLLDAQGRRQYHTFDPSTPDNPNAELPWYRGTGTKDDYKLDHAWMIGFVPADDPKIAFAVLVEYGGSGGGAAADVVKASLEACIAHGYLQPRAPQDPSQQARLAPRAGSELIFSVPGDR